MILYNNFVCYILHLFLREQFERNFVYLKTICVAGVSTWSWNLQRYFPIMPISMTISIILLKKNYYKHSRISFLRNSELYRWHNLILGIFLKWDEYKGGFKGYEFFEPFSELLIIIIIIILYNIYYNYKIIKLYIIKLYYII